jgi:UDP-N-acetylglucosamine--N-acetylmuramyl-(pentapeptide) pyrophosphoryl-undecaprenol N-acetylglucosamine transferase
MDRYFPSKKIVITGNPVRQQLIGLREMREESLREFQLEAGKKLCLLVGGSLGARTLNRSFMAGLEKLDREDLQVLWQCGRYYHEEVKEKVQKSGLSNTRVLPFISRMDLAYEAADIVVSRAGALSISELCLVGKPAILVPSPNVAEDHQTHNAEALVSKTAALMVSDADAEEQLVDTMLGLLEDEKLRKELSQHIKKLGIPDASQRIASEVYKILEEK